jgi:hypothetical protein
MKNINIDIVRKVLIIVSVVYSLFLMTIIAINSQNGRYTPIGNIGYFIDTKTGNIYHMVKGELKILE